MDALHRSHRVLAEAEKQLRALIEAAAHERSYEIIPAIARLAQGVARLTEDQTQPVERSEPRPAGKKEKPARYPYFRKADGNLFKIGWSKKAEQEYRHKAPRSALSELVNAIRIATNGGHSFTMNDVLPLKTTNGGAEIPDYQAYLCLAWLRDLGLLEKKAQGVYVGVGSLSDLAVEEAWDDLPVLY